jgi:hypothetical protein
VTILGKVNAVRRAHVGFPLSVLLPCILYCMLWSRDDSEALRHIYIFVSTPRETCTHVAWVATVAQLQASEAHGHKRVHSGGRLS